MDLGDVIRLAMADEEKSIDRYADMLQQSVDNLTALGVSESDARRAIEPLTQEVAGKWLTELVRRVNRMAGANPAKAKAERKHGIYQGLVEIAYRFHSPAWNPSKREMAKEVHEMIISAGYDDSKHPVETIRKNIEILS